MSRMRDTVETAIRSWLREQNAARFSYEEVRKLYEYLVSHSELSAEAILHEIHSLLANVRMGGFPVPYLGIEEIAFLVEHNRYQEKDHRGAGGGYSDIDVHGYLNSRHFFLISETNGLVEKTIRIMQAIIERNPGLSYRFSSFSLTNVRTGDVRRLFVLEEEKQGPADPTATEKACDSVAEYLSADRVPFRDEDVRSFVLSASVKFIASLGTGEGRRLVSHYFYSWRAFLDLLGKAEDMYIYVHPMVGETAKHPEKNIMLWISREKFQSNFGTINRIFIRRGIVHTRQYFETFTLGGRTFIALSTFSDGEYLTPELEEYMKKEIYTRCLLLKSSPVSVGQIKNILDNIKSYKDYEKLELIGVMQRNKQKEYLIPLVLLLNEPNEDVRKKAFGLIRHYLLNPTHDMKDDYYWSTLMHIFSAATIPLEREKDRPSRSLSDDEIIRLIRFRDIYFREYTEPVTRGNYLFIRMNGIGIGKGGIRADIEHVTFSGEGALSTNMLLKTLGLGIPLYTTGKGGILGDVRFSGTAGEQRAAARKNVLEAYADFLYHESGVGPLSDVPAGDVGIGADEIGIIFEKITDDLFSDLQALAQGGSADQRTADRVKWHFGINTGDPDGLKSLAADRARVRAYSSSSITGKPGSEGLALRSGATGRGLVEVLATQQNYQDFNDPGLWFDVSRTAEAIGRDEVFSASAYQRIKMLTFSLQGFGKVGTSLARILARIGAVIRMISDASGTLVNEHGILHIEELAALCMKGDGRLADVPHELLDGSEFFPSNTVLPLTAVVDVAVPAALEEVITNSEDSGGRHIFVRSFEADYLLQGANGPISSEAEEVLEDMGRVSFPDILANSGGVLASYLEWLNGLIRLFGYRKIYDAGFVHRIVHNLILHFYPDAVTADLRNVDEGVYGYAFKFILRWATVKTIRLSRAYGVSMRTAYIAIGIRNAAEEGRLTEQFGTHMDRVRDTFSTR